MIDILDYCDASVIAEGMKLTESKRRLKLKIEHSEDNNLVISAKFRDRFNFVDRAAIVANTQKGLILSSRCDCMVLRDEPGICPHCASLLIELDKLQQQLTAAEAEDMADKTVTGQMNNEPTIRMPMHRVTAESRPMNRDTIDSETANIRPAIREVTASYIEDDPDMIGIRDLTYSFCNSARDLYPETEHPKFRLESFQTVFGKTRYAKQLYKNYCEWDGSCFGISSTAALFYRPDNNIAVPDFRRGAAYPSDLQLNDCNRNLDLPLRDFIEIMQLTQFDERIGHWYNILNSPEHSIVDVLESICMLVEEFQQDKQEPVVMAVWKNDQFDGGHAVLPFRYERLGKLRSRLHIYDPNWPGEVRYCDLHQNKHGYYDSWRFQMFDDVYYSSDGGGEIAFVPYEEFKTAWDERKDHKPKALFTTGLEDITVRDADGSDVVLIAAGKITALRDDVVPVRVTSGSGAAARRCFWIDQGEYEVINDDPDTTLNFSLAGENSEVEIETEASGVKVEINDNENFQKAEIAEPEKAFIARMGGAAEDILLRAVTSQSGALITNNADKITIRKITCRDIVEFRINDEDADPDHYIETEKTENTASETETTDCNETTCDRTEQSISDHLYILNSKLDPKKE